MTATMDVHDVFDSDHLAKYTLGDAALECEVLELFIDQAAIYRQRLLDAQTGDAWREAAHSLKGSARGVGAFLVGERALALEKADRPASRAARETALQPLDRDFGQTIAAMKRHLAAAGQNLSASS